MSMQGEEQNDDDEEDEEEENQPILQKVRKVVNPNFAGDLCCQI